MHSSNQPLEINKDNSSSQDGEGNTDLSSIIIPLAIPHITADITPPALVTEHPTAIFLESSSEEQITIYPQNGEESSSHEEEMESENSRNCAILCEPLLYTGPALKAILDGLSFAGGLTKLKTVPLPLIITISTADALSSLGLTGKTTSENFHQAYNIIKKADFPSDWPVLSRTKEGIAVALCIVPVVFAPLTESMQTYLYFDGLPDEYNFKRIHMWHKVGGISAAILVGLTAALTDSSEMYTLTRALLAGRRPSYKHAFSKIGSLAVGVPLSLMDAIIKSLEGYMAVKAIVNINTLNASIAVGVPSIVNAIPFFCFSGIYNIEALKRFLEVEHPFKPKKIIAMTLSFSFAVALAFVRRPLNLQFYQQDVPAEFNIDPQDIPWQAYTALGWAMFAQETIQATATFYSPIYYLIDGTCQILDSLIKSLYTHLDIQRETDHSYTEESSAGSTDFLISDSSRDEHIQVHDDIPRLQEQDIKNIRLIINSPRVSNHAATLFSKAEKPNTNEEIIPSEDYSQTSNWCVLM